MNETNQYSSLKSNLIYELNNLIHKNAEVQKSIETLDKLREELEGGETNG